MPVPGLSTKPDLRSDDLALPQLRDLRRRVAERCEHRVVVGPEFRGDADLRRRFREMPRRAVHLQPLAVFRIVDLGVVIESADERDRLLQTLDGLFATGSRDVWVERLREADIVSAPINTLLEAADDPDVVANGYVTEIDYPKYGKRLKVHGSPWQFSETPARPGIAPELGAHTDEILGRLGYTPAQIDDLRRRRIV